MRSVAELLERECATVDLQGDHFERMLRRRDRKRRNQRIAVYGLVAGIAVAGMIGIATMRSKDEVKVTPGSHATPTAAPFPFLHDGALEPGTYVFSAPISSFDAYRITMSVPDGYEGEGGFVALKLGRTSQTGVSAWAVGDVYADPCHRVGPLPDRPAGASVDGLVAALASQRGLHVSTPTAITVDGYAGMYMERTVPVGTDLADCTGGEFRVWVATGGGDRYVEPGQQDLLWIVDVDGIPLVIDAALEAGISAKDRAEIIRIAESVRIDRR